jgi:hypothetical protein
MRFWMVLMRPYLENRLEKEDSKGEGDASMASAECLAMARGAGAAHAEEGLPQQREISARIEQCGLASRV